MPLVRIDLHTGKPAEYRRGLGEIVYHAMVDVLRAPEHDRFQVITEHTAGALHLTESYLGVVYSSDVILIQITLNAGRTPDQKREFYRRLADDLHARLGVRREDVVVNLVETAPENWSFGNGIAQYAG